MLIRRFFPAASFLAFCFAASCALLGLQSHAQSAFPDKCDNGNPLPFDAIKVSHPLDGSCGIIGKTTSSVSSHAQNSAKNNFCAVATSGTPEIFTPQMLTDLQASAGLVSGQGKEPPDRGDEQAAGEGKLIRMKAFLIEAHHADLGGGESVNCNGPKEEDNDIHIAFATDSGAEECSSVSAEISPHFRPASWNEIGHYEKYNSSSHLYAVDPQISARLQSQAYRVTGQLFFDASHGPCPCGTKCNPVRSSVWEIHPVYAIEVCRAGATCDVNTDSDWVAFDTWWTSLTPLKKVRPPHSHTPHEPKTPAKPKTPHKPATPNP